MNDKRAENLGKRALKLGLPWTAGMLCGPVNARVTIPKDLSDYYPDIWPDFRDPITEAWLVDWAGRVISAAGVDVRETPNTPRRGMWQVVAGGYCGHSYSRAAGWLAALDSLR
jgi:hypothetical protein